MQDGLGQSQPSPGLSVDVCICTYRRASLTDTLQSLVDQGRQAGVSMRVVVADNDESACGKPGIEQAAMALGLPLQYLHAPARSISIARNACLDCAQGDWIAFIDDDEIARPGWLTAMLEVAQSSEFDAVLGPVSALYAPDAPSWMREGDFHSTRPVLRRGQIETGYSGNVLIRRAFLARTGLRFDLQFGRTGGEDVDFFYRFRDLGGRIGFAPHAFVDEPVPAARAKIGWLLRRSFRAGQTHGTRLCRRAGTPAERLRDMAAAMLKAAACAVGAGVMLWRPSSRYRYVTRGVLHLGVAARVIGLREIQSY